MVEFEAARPVAPSQIRRCSRFTGEKLPAKLRGVSSMMAQAASYPSSVPVSARIAVALVVSLTRLTGSGCTTAPLLSSRAGWSLDGLREVNHFGSVH